MMIRLGTCNFYLKFHSYLKIILFYLYVMFFVSLYCIHNWWNNKLQVWFLSRNSTSTSLFSLIFWFMVKFFHLHQKVLGFMIFPKTKSLIFFRCSPFILFFEFSQIFFYIPSSHIFICAYLSYYIHADYFLLIYLFLYIFININIGCGHSVKKKKHFGCVHQHK